MFIEFNKIILFFYLACVISGTATAASAFSSTYASYPVKSTEFTLKGEPQEFNIVETKYADDTVISYISKGNAVYDSPENAIIARFSALAAMDLPWWRSQWETTEQATESLRHLMANGATEDEILKRWGNITKFKQIKLVRRISYKNYVIFTYRVLNKGQKLQKNGIEFPLVFKKVGDYWKVSSDLSYFPMIRHSPWVTGNYNVVEKNIWAVQEND